MKETRKWIFHRVSAVIVAPLYVWFYFTLISLSTKNYQETIYFFENSLAKKKPSPEDEPVIKIFG